MGHGTFQVWKIQSACLLISPWVHMPHQLHLQLFFFFSPEIDNAGGWDSTPRECNRVPQDMARITPARVGPPGRQKLKSLAMKHVY